MSKHLSRLLPYQGADADLLADRIAKVADHPNIEVFLSSQAEEIRGFLGNFRVTITSQNGSSQSRDIGVGAIIVATGFDLYDIKQNPKYGRPEAENILSAVEFEDKLIADKLETGSGQPPKSIALIHCAGREELGYCSRACCTYMLRYAKTIKEKFQDMEVLEVYSDLCLPNKNDQAFLETVKDSGVKFVRTEGDVELKEQSGRVEVAFTRAGEKQSFKADMAVLAPGFVPSRSTEEIAAKLNIPLDESGYFKELHQILDPVATPAEGVYIVGCASGPKNIPESIIQAQAAAGKIFAGLIPGRTIKTEAKVAEVREEFCTGCQTCLTVCFYGAISFSQTKGVSMVNEAICRGCGSCVGSCPSGAIRAKHFTDYQIFREIMSALR